MNILWGLLGVISILGLGFILSKDRKNIHTRTIVVGLIIQFVFAYIVLKSTLGRTILVELSLGVQGIISFVNEGIDFLFGPLVRDASGMIFVLEVLTVIVFFSSLISILYYLGIMQWIINVIGGFLSKLLHTSKPESISAAGNIFIGHTEAPLLIRPFINKMSNSEIFAVMVGGMASTSGAVLVGYSLLGIPLEYLLAASFMAAPSGLVMSKIMFPHTKEKMEEILNGSDAKDVKAGDELFGDEKPSNIIDAAANGAATGMNIIISVTAMLLAFISLIALVNAGFGFVGGLFGFEDLTMDYILGFILAPFAFLLGVPWDEAFQAGQFIGQKIVINEFVAFAGLGPMFDELSLKTGMILSFAIAGYGNFGSIAIQIGTIGGLAKERRKDASMLGLRAMIAGSLATCLNGAIAGMFLF
ncbi:NupC/NupG family nucleoside CNT transporter [Sporosarcina pasteurii]|uniref:NupC/NupG family nucleoside CNT transporter n=1 Tax=Sporosarcina pasteurii TaxID=1474 RepID=UPI000E1B6F77|nr:nucleoside transporter C-terminal domain-containing protein [Sporosarcina pasteurii]MDS9472610.1 nucleoside transporter C-terminal domain-containing protein [Sporosarcina pasteurii]QBQ07135.1 NupC/NupG family nucleoside CNT transporter [Sporosarcina pasteurii]